MSLILKPLFVSFVVLQHVIGTKRCLSFVSFNIDLKLKPIKADIRLKIMKIEKKFIGFNIEQDSLVCLIVLRFFHTE